MKKTHRCLVFSALALLGAMSPPSRGEPAAAAAAAEPHPTPQSIYLPYEKLWETFEKDGRGVFLPYAEFMELWKAAEAGKTRPLEAQPPVGALIKEVSGVARAGQDVMEISATVTVEALRPGWHEIPLRLGDVAVLEAKLDGQPARLLGGPGEGYRLLLRHEGAEARTYRLALTFARSFVKQPGRNSLSFASPVAPVSRWEILVPDAGVSVQVEPSIATTTAPPEEGAAGTRVLAFVGAAPQVGIQWTRKAEGARGLQALATVHAEQVVQVMEGVTKTTVRLAYTISRDELPSLRVQIPAGQRILGVEDANVREWTVEEQDGVQIVLVQLFEPARGAQRLSIELERHSAELLATAPVVRALDASRQEGVVSVSLGAGLRGEVVRRDGLAQLDARELPRTMPGQAWLFTGRYAALPFQLELRMEALVPRIRVDALTVVRIEPDSLDMELLTVHRIERAGVFEIGLLIPEGFEVREVSGHGSGGAKPAAVDGHHLGDAVDGMRRMTVNLSARAEGPTGVRVALRRPLAHPELLQPTGGSARIPLTIPRAGVEGVEWEQGYLAVFLRDSLRIQPETLAGLQPASMREATSLLPAAPDAGMRPALSLRYAGDAVSLVLAAERRPPHVSVFQVVTVGVEPGLIRYDARLNYEVSYSGVKALLLAVPEAIESRIRILTPNLRHRREATPPADVTLPADHVLWVIEGETEFLGARPVRMAWEDPMDDLDVGRTVERAVPRLIPLGVSRAWGQVVLTKAESIDVNPGTVFEGLRPIDPRHDLHAEARSLLAARAFEFHQDWALSVQATRYEPLEVKTSSIERGWVRMVLTRSGLTSVQALYRMRSTRQRVAVRLPGTVQFDTEPARINGRVVGLEKGADGQYFIPLVAQAQDDAFLLELRYVVDEGGKALRPPEFPEDPALQQINLSVFIPEEWAYLGHRGPWMDELVWVTDGLNSWPRARRDTEVLLGWVTEGVSVDLSALRTFATDGRHLLYSALRPSPGAAGALRITTAHRLTTRLALSLLGVGLGLVLLWAGWPRRLMAAGAGVTALVLLGVFAPSLARAVVNTATAGAVFTVLLVWALWYVLVTLPRSPLVQERRAARAARAAAPRPPAPPPVPESAAPAAGKEDGHA
jgi:hypothetical protein